MLKKKKVILLTPVLAHYRDDVYKLLLESDDYEFEMLGGENYLGIKSLTGDNYKIFEYFSFKFFKHKFFFLKRSIKYIFSQKPDIIITAGIDFHLLHTLIVFLIHKIIFRKKFYWWSHGTDGNQGKLGLLIRKYIYKHSSGVILYSEQGKYNLIKMGLKEKKLKVVKNCLNYEDYGYLKYDLSKEKKKDVFTILYVGRITKEKKVELLIEALGILNKQKSFVFKCYIVGDGNLEPLIDLAKRIEVYDKIDFTGPVYGKEVHQFFMQSDLFVYPGEIGLSLVHAFSFGLPLITNDDDLHGPELELLEIDVNSDLYEKESSKDLADKILKWKEILEKDNRNISKNCINSIKTKGYLPDQVSKKTLDFLKE